MFELCYGSVTATLNKLNIIFAGEFNLIHLVSRDEKFLVFAHFTIQNTYMWILEERVVAMVIYHGKSEVSLNVKTPEQGSL